MPALRLEGLLRGHASGATPQHEVKKMARVSTGHFGIWIPTLEAPDRHEVEGQEVIPSVEARI